MCWCSVGNGRTGFKLLCLRQPCSVGESLCDTDLPFPHRLTRLWGANPREATPSGRHPELTRFRGANPTSSGYHLPSHQLARWEVSAVTREVATLSLAPAGPLVGRLDNRCFCDPNLAPCRYASLLDRLTRPLESMPRCLAQRCNSVASFDAQPH